MGGYQKKNEEINSHLGSYDNINVGSYEILHKGKDIVILAIGVMVKHALEARDILLKEGINPTIVNARFLKPIDNKLLNEQIRCFCICGDNAQRTNIVVVVLVVVLVVAVVVANAPIANRNARAEI